MYRDWQAIQPVWPGRRCATQISGPNVVWQENRGDSWQVSGYNLSTKTEYQVTHDGGSGPAISGDTIVYAGGSLVDSLGNRYHGLCGYDLASQHEFPIHVSPDLWADFAFSGTTVVWFAWCDGSCDVYGATLSAPQPLASACTFDFAADAASGWHVSRQTVRLRASGGVGDRRVVHLSTDGGATWTAQAGDQIDVPLTANGSHHFLYYARDMSSVEATPHGGDVNIDTAGPTTAGRATSGRKGRAITLRYKVTDSLSAKATAIRIVVKNSHGIAVKTIQPTTKATAIWHSVKWTPNARGAHIYYVYAKDLAGNAQVKVGSAKVFVRQMPHRRLEIAMSAVDDG